MNAAPRTDSSLDRLQAMRATASFERASTSVLDRKFMTNIKIVKLTLRNVKNEGCSQDVIENKGRKTTHFDQPQYVYEKKDVSSICQYVYENK
jgi:hypothetical protein